MKMHDVKSSHIEAIGHEGETLHVRFKGGVTYSYPGVTAERFKKLMGAKSIGNHLRGMGVKGEKLK